MDPSNSLQKDSPAWLLFVRLSFGIALAATTIGILWIPVDWWIRGYLWMGLYFTVTTTITMSKTLRDEHEAKKFIKQLNEARTEKLLAEFSPQ